ncbi:hypothetical protein QR680_007672 [Steinernema hermaphroditum]|uniref:ERAP1-like C-terminal domain-containing protein n=1 Tax=Steinernema hermaphroditum TaxID=289476 RepID=A0AA39M6I2_9BILA|nr:hypothetical protein QR680_007672 [Steinernema hermaphroditum]
MGEKNGPKAATTTALHVLCPFLFHKRGPSSIGTGFIIVVLTRSTLLAQRAFRCNQPSQPRMWLKLFLSLLWVAAAHSRDHMDFPDVLVPEKYAFSFMFEKFELDKQYTSELTLRVTTTSDITQFGLHFDRDDPVWVLEIDFPDGFDYHVTASDPVLKTSVTGNFSLYTLSHTIPKGTTMELQISFMARIGIRPEDGLYATVDINGDHVYLTHFKQNHAPRVLPCINLLKYVSIISFSIGSTTFVQEPYWKVLTNQEMYYEIEDPGSGAWGMFKPKDPDYWPIGINWAGFAIGKFTALGYAPINALDDHRTVHVYSTFHKHSDAPEAALFAHAWEWLAGLFGPQRPGGSAYTTPNDVINIIVIQDEAMDDLSWRGPQVYSQLVFIPRRYGEQWNDADWTKPWKREEAHFHVVRAAFDHWLVVKARLYYWRNLFIAQGLSGLYTLTYLEKLVEEKKLKLDVTGMFVDLYLNEAFEMDTVAHNDTVQPLLETDSSEFPLPDPADIDQLDNTVSHFKTIQWLRQMRAYVDRPQDFDREAATAYNAKAYPCIFHNVKGRKVPCQSDYKWTSLTFIQWLSELVDKDNAAANLWTIGWVKQRFYPLVQLDIDRFPGDADLAQKLYIPYPFNTPGHPRFTLNTRWPIPFHFQTSDCNKMGYAGMFYGLFEKYKKVSMESIQNPSCTGKWKWAHIANRASNYFKVFHIPQLLDALMPGLDTKEIGYLDRFAIIRDFGTQVKQGFFPEYVKKFFSYIAGYQFGSEAYENQIIVWSALRELVYAAAKHNYDPKLTEAMWKEVYYVTYNYLVFYFKRWHSPWDDKYTTQRIKNIIEELRKLSHSKMTNEVVVEKEWEDYFQAWLNGTITKDPDLFPKQIAFRQHGQLFGMQGFEDLKALYGQSNDPGHKGMILGAMVMTEDVDVLEKTFDFVLEEAIKLKVQRYVFEAALQSATVSDFILKYFEGKPETQTSRLFTTMYYYRQGVVLEDNV